jgi:glycosyltransferase involved in cell wall biosynthesis
LKATIFIATYNQADFIAEALESALNQTYPQNSYEVLLINDGSTDATPSILKKYDSKIKIVHQENHGLGPTCNQGLALASGEYFIRLDSDDFFDPTILSKMIPLLEKNHGVAAIYSDRYELHAKEKKIIQTSANDIYSMVACGVMMRTQDVREVGGYQKTFWEEYDLFIRLSKKGKFIHLNEPLYHYRFHEHNMTNNIANRQAGWRELIKLHGEKKVMKAGNIQRFKELEEILNHAH